MNIKILHFAALAGLGCALAGPALAHVEYHDLNATPTVTGLSFTRDGWIRGTNTPTNPPAAGDTSAFLGDSHEMQFFKFHLDSANTVTIEFVADAGAALDPAFSVYRGLLPDKGHDNTIDDPLNAEDPVTGEPIPHPKDAAYWDSTKIRDGQFDAFGKWSMSSEPADGGNWGEIEYVAHKNDSTGEAVGAKETLTLPNLAAGDYTIAAAGALVTASTTLRGGTMKLTIGAAPEPSPGSSPTPAPSGSPVPSASPSASPAPTTGPIASPNPSTSPSPSPSASPRPTPSPANCSPSGKNAKPVVDAIAPTWDAEVGQTLEVPVFAVDCDDDAIDIKVTKAPPGSSLSAEELDSASRKWVSLLSWTPNAGQANKTYPLVLRAFETETSAHLGSQPRKAKIRVWPEGGISAGAISSLTVSRAQWKAGSGQLTVTGKAKFSPLLTPAERKALVAGTALSVVNGSKALVSGVSVKASGQWTARLSVSEAQVPCAVSAAFGGKATAARSVQGAPGACLP